MGRLVTCEDCGNPVSSEAMACPHCGKPNKTAKGKQRDQVQKGGCLVLIVGVLFCAVSPIFGGIIAAVGVIIVLVGLVMR